MSLIQDFPLQSLFMKLTSMQQTAMEVLVGRDRVAQLFLMRLTEAFLIWLSDDQEFWEAIEQGPRSLGAIGLQQVGLQHSFLPRAPTPEFCKMLVFVVCILVPCNLTAKPEPYKCITNMVVQFVLDMHFLKQVSLYGKFLSRITHQLIGCVIEHACHAFAATGADPSRFF